jgi:hypothetical protein
LIDAHLAAQPAAPTRTEAEPTALQCAADMVVEAVGKASERIEAEQRMLRAAIVWANDSTSGSIRSEEGLCNAVEDYKSALEANK